jgi:hypothetical protein
MLISVRIENFVVAVVITKMKIRYFRANHLYTQELLSVEKPGLDVSLSSFLFLLYLPQLYVEFLLYLMSY